MNLNTSHRQLEVLNVRCGHHYRDHFIVVEPSATGVKDNVPESAPSNVRTKEPLSLSFILSVRSALALLFVLKILG